MTIVIKEQTMYQWRQLTPAQRNELLEHRRSNRFPWHSPPHFEIESGLYLVTAACYEHRPIIGASSKRMADFETELLETCEGECCEIYAWVILPNHYHVLLRSEQLQALLKAIGKLHGRTSFLWNGEDRARGRKVWSPAAETAMKSERHFWATFNYVLHNAVRHGYAAKWQDWPYSNAVDYLDEVGAEEARRRWKEYPILDFGKDWDPADM